MKTRESNYKLEFTLKQHTPLIHFQGTQKGATLRATELKPKLDRFLIKRLEMIGGDGKPKEEYRDWFIGGGKLHHALDYKVRIEQDDSNQYDPTSDSLYFGNQGDETREGGETHWKDYKRNPNPFVVYFFSFKPQLLDEIGKHFEAFLANTNFGTRQSKGYGSFYLCSGDDCSENNFDQSLIEFNSFSFSTSSVSWEKELKLFYQFLRQGINMPTDERGMAKKITICHGEEKYTKFYCKPAIFSYAKSQQWTWDKKMIKKTLLSDVLEKQQDCRPNNDVLHDEFGEEYLLRDLFGLSSYEKWDNHFLKKTHNTIKRFKSPITFKPIKETSSSYRIYFWVNDSYRLMLDQTFDISLGNSSFSMKTPIEFDYNDFFQHAFGIALGQHVERDFHNTDEYRILSNILQQLRSQI